MAHHRSSASSAGSRRSPEAATSLSRPTSATRWEQSVTGDAWDSYVARFDHLVDAGEDLDGEARLLDAMVPRGAWVLDAGSGTGRVTAALTRMGHRAIGVDRDARLVEHARLRYPEAPYLVSDLLELEPGMLADEGFGEPFDLVALPGNVLVYVAPGTERAVLAGMFALLAPGGRVVAGFATDRDYTVDLLDLDLAAVGFVHEHRFATWQLDPWPQREDDARPGWQVTVARRPLR